MSDQWAHLTLAHRDARTSAGGDVPDHRPKAAILACSDARVPPSIIFGQPAGELFVVRIAGNTASPAAVASLDYAVAHLGIELIVVLGHTSCGAVAAAVEGGFDEFLEPVIGPISDIANAHPSASADAVGELSVADTIGALTRHDGPVGAAARQGSLEIRGAVHDLSTGALKSIANPTPTNMPQEAQ